MTAGQPASDSSADAVRAAGFAQCTIALRRALGTTPVGWALACWLGWGQVPLQSIGMWLGWAVLIWIAGLFVLQRTISAGSYLARHGPRFRLVAALDGLAWGLLTWFLIGYDPVLDAVLMAVLCGVASVNAQVYGTYVQAYYGQIGLMWTAVVLGLLHAGSSRNALDYIAGFSVFVGLTAYYTRATSQRLLEGIRLQQVNASLAAQLRIALAQMAHDASTDALTGHWNRRALDDAMQQQHDRRLASGRPFSILMLDIDFFKAINDRFGHMVGDEVLRAFAQRLGAFLRSDDFCARFGGEEFVVVLPDTPLDKAMEIGERIRQNIGQTPLLASPELCVTVSVGVATMDGQQTIPELFAAADAALYLAKNDGRNQVRSPVQAGQAPVPADPPRGAMRG